MRNGRRAPRPARTSGARPERMREGGVSPSGGLQDRAQGRDPQPPPRSRASSGSGALRNPARSAARGRTRRGEPGRVRQDLREQPGARLEPRRNPSRGAPIRNPLARARPAGIAFPPRRRTRPGSRGLPGPGGRSAPVRPREEPLSSNSSFERPALEAHAAASRERFEDLLRKFVEIPSVSNDPARKDDIHRMIDLAGSTLIDFGFESRILKTKGNPILHGRRVVDANAPTVTIYNHLDVQPGGEAPDWKTDPFVFTRA